ncbi:MAG: hypothetical protein R3E93_00605 [Thiothrix sp.]
MLVAEGVFVGQVGAASVGKLVAAGMSAAGYAVGVGAGQQVAR